MAKEYKKCYGCSRNCIIGIYAYTGIPADQSFPIEGTTPEGQETNDIRPYCKANFIPEPES